MALCSQHTDGAPAGIWFENHMTRMARLLAFLKSTRPFFGPYQVTPNLPASWSATSLMLTRLHTTAWQPVMTATSGEVGQPLSTKSPRQPVLSKYAGYLGCVVKAKISEDKLREKALLRPPFRGA